MIQRIKKSVVRKSTKKKAEQVRHIFHVTDILLWKVVIFRYVFVRETAKSVVVLNLTHQEKTHRKQSDQGGWFFDIGEARNYARELMAERKEKIDKIVEQFNKGHTEIESGQVRCINPRKLKKIDINKVEF